MRCSYTVTAGHGYSVWPAPKNHETDFMWKKSTASPLLISCLIKQILIPPPSNKESGDCIREVESKSQQSQCNSSHQQPSLCSNFGTPAPWIPAQTTQPSRLTHNRWNRPRNKLCAGEKNKNKTHPSIQGSLVPPVGGHHFWFQRIKAWNMKNLHLNHSSPLSWGLGMGEEVTPSLKM